MIIATAGHIDHGKTVLVKALTGVETDRLPEERRRGMSIDLGYAYHPLPGGGSLGFIDVPGHERFVHNMLAGVTGIDFGLLVVAADDGAMPQTFEHLAILDLLGLSHGAIAITKTDRAEDGRVGEVTAAVTALIADTNLAGAPIFPVSAITGQGIDELRGYIEAEAQSLATRAGGGHFRLAIDRVFTIQGTGLVVTGTVFSGTVRTGDRLVLSPGAIEVRVRGIHAQNQPAELGHAGQRCALNLAGPGLDRGLIRRGDWVLEAGAHHPTARLDARIRLLKSEAKALGHWTPAHIHLGAADVPGRVAVLEGRQVAPGAVGWVQLVLDRPIGALRGDRLILRDQSARRTIGGGVIIDPFPPRRGRARPERLAQIRAMAGDDAATALGRMVEAAPEGVDLGGFIQAWNLLADDAAALKAGVPMMTLEVAGGTIAMDQARWRTLSDGIMTALGDWHAAHPTTSGIAANSLRRALPHRLTGAFFDAIVDELAARGEVAKSLNLIRLAGHQTALGPAEARLWARIKPELDGKGAPPVVHDIAKNTSLEPNQVAKFLRHGAELGLVVRIAENRYLLPGAVVELARIAEAMAGDADDGMITVAGYRDRTGIGRNLVIELLEFFDKAGFTRRDGNTRRVLKPAEDAFARYQAGP
ncbi:MAG: selenocysteine-specific translation elongation factor [Alphaproteobacteria bacterium]